MTEFGTLAQKRSWLVILFVTWLGAFPSHHGVTLRTEVCGGAFREVETGLLLHDADAAGFGIFDDIVSECDIIVAYVPLYIQRMSVRGLATDNGAFCVLGHMTLFDSVKVVVGLDVFSCLALESQVTVVPEIAFESQPGRGEHLLAAVFDRIQEFGLRSLLYFDYKFSVRTAKRGREA